MMKSGFRDLWDTISCANISIMGVPEVDRKGQKVFEETMFKKIQNSKKHNLLIQEAQQTASRINSKTAIPRHIILKLSKDRENLESRKRQTALWKYLNKKGSNRNKTKKI